MRKSTRFAAAVHILTMLAAIEEDYLSSDVIARSMNTNRVVVRRLIASLAQAGFVSSQAGVLGGARLDVDPSSITLLDVYRAVEDEGLFKFHAPHPLCGVGELVLTDLQKAITKAESAFEKQLAATPLASVADRGIRKMKQYIRQGKV
ncbi:MAG: Rrf2 family transcriptional regulator [Planctomycetaceae bacterium]|nr:Rrf2 family transcriptional regulator [Planctomycetaceae bacterium]